MIEVGKFVLKSTEDSRPSPTNLIEILFPPSTVVYFPNHVSSQISLLALEKHLKPGMTFLELGAGTCVLSIAAEKLGASKVFATENHPEALAYCNRILKINGCVKISLINGTFIDEEVDLCIANTDAGEKWVRKNRDSIKAKKIIAISDDSATEVIVKE